MGTFNVMYDSWAQPTLSARPRGPGSRARRRARLPGGAARAWRVLDRDGKVAKTSWFVIDRAGRVEWSDGGPAASQAAVRLED